MKERAALLGWVGQYHLAIVNALRTPSFLRREISKVSVFSQRRIGIQIKPQAREIFCERAEQDHNVAKKDQHK